MVIYLCEMATCLKQIKTSLHSIAPSGRRRSWKTYKCRSNNVISHIQNIYTCRFIKTNTLIAIFRYRFSDAFVRGCNCNTLAHLVTRSSFLITIGFESDSTFGYIQKVTINSWVEESFPCVLSEKQVCVRFELNVTGLKKLTISAVINWSRG